MMREETGCPETIGMSRRRVVKQSVKGCRAFDAVVHNRCVWIEAEVWYVED